MKPGRENQYYGEKLNVVKRELISSRVPIVAKWGKGGETRISPFFEDGGQGMGRRK